MILLVLRFGLVARNELKSSYYKKEILFFAIYPYYG